MISGISNVAVTSSTTNGHILIQAVGNIAQTLNPDTATVGQSCRSFGRVLDTATVTGSTRTLVRAALKLGIP